jgi:hypothetical protein
MNATLMYVGIGAGPFIGEAVIDAVIDQQAYTREDMESTLRAFGGRTVVFKRPNSIWPAGG